MAMVADVTAGVSRRVDHSETCPQFRDSDLITFGNGMAYAVNMLAGRTIHRHLIMGQNFPDAADMVAMMMGNQDRDRLQRLLAQPLQHNLGIARIKHGSKT